MRKYSLLILFLFFSWHLAAKRIVVSTANEITNGAWFPNDTIVMKNGIWTDNTIVFKGIGTASQPIVLIAETPGSVILNGTSKLSMSGKYLEVNGLYFKEGNLSGSDIVAFRTSTSELAENCRLTNTAIVSYNPPLNTVDSKWVSLYGKNNKVDRCSFVNKNNSGALLVVWLTSGVTVNHQITDNYFGYRIANKDANGNELNGQEIIRVGDSSTSMTFANCTISGNFFEKCNGEIEIISNKSCGNLYRNNLFLECRGMLTLRHGNACTVEGNYFFGNGVSESGGVRIIGEDHKVYNNYFENLRGTNFRSAICMVRGMENSALNDYFQVKNALVAFNTMVNCTQSFSINYNSSTSYKMPPVGTVIAHNHVYNTTTSSRINVNINTTSLASMDITWVNNLMNMGSYTNFAYNSTQVITGKDAKMITIPTTIPMFEPSAESALIEYSTAEYSFIMNDIRGRVRGAIKIPGASQLSGEINSEMPVKKNVGGFFLNNANTAVNKINENCEIKIRVDNLNLVVDTEFPAFVAVYDSSGKIILQQSINPGTNTLSINRTGLFLVKTIKSSGAPFSAKIVLK